MVKTMNLSDAVAAVFQLTDREVWVVTAAAGNRRGGLLATWVSEASIDREHPTVLAGIAPNHFTAELIDAAGGFAAHLLRADQIALALDFALGSGRDRDKLQGLAVTIHQTGSPVLHDCLAWLDCRVYARLEAGDRIYYWADAVAAGCRGSQRPLTQAGLLAAANDEQHRLLRDDLRHDVALQRPWAAAWREHLPDILLPKSDRSGRSD
jgi:flavin reductase (DIM6/NTAB) family NADH-FMN oxidoreductase RutF